jgi:hypothetical protein
MDSIIHFIKHALGLCGESHPSLLLGGVGIVSYCICCYKLLQFKLRNSLIPKEKRRIL